MASLILFLLGVLAALPAIADDGAIEIDVPQVILSKIPFTAQVQLADMRDIAGYRLEVDGQIYTPADLDSATLVFDGLVKSETGLTLIVLSRNKLAVEQVEIRSIAAWLSIVPPLIGILVALFLRSVIPALFLGAWVGAWLLTGLSFS